jgi:hypothetical protein
MATEARRLYELKQSINELCRIYRDYADSGWSPIETAAMVAEKTRVCKRAIAAYRDAVRQAPRRGDRRRKPARPAPPSKSKRRS